MMKIEQRQLGRAKNSLLTFFEKKLAVPRIYLDTIWERSNIDVLSIDRDGVGDVHVALLLSRPYFPNGELDIISQAQEIEVLLERLEHISANWKYIVAVDANPQRRSAALRLSDILSERTFASDGIGRVGMLLVDFLIDEEAQTRIVIKAERFRAKVGEIADKYVQQHSADWEIRA